MNYIFKDRVVLELASAPRQAGSRPHLANVALSSLLGNKLAEEGEEVCGAAKWPSLV